MAYSTSTIIDGPIVSVCDGDLSLSWTSSASPGTWYQVYVNRRLCWWGQTTWAIIPAFPDHSYIDVVSVDTGDQTVDYSGSFAALPGRNVIVSFQGGESLGNVHAYNIYQSATSGGSVDYSKPVATAKNASASISQAGYGMGGYGDGGYGMSQVNFYFASSTLKTGSAWKHGIKTVDPYGNLSSAVEVTTGVIAPPHPPSNLKIVVNPSTLVPTLTWNAPP